MRAAHSKTPTLRTSSNSTGTHSTPSTLLRSTTANHAAKSLTLSAMPGARSKTAPSKQAVEMAPTSGLSASRPLPYDRLICANGRFARQGSQFTTTTTSKHALQSRSFAAEQANGCASWKDPHHAGLETAGLKRPSQSPSTVPQGFCPARK
jgi:hypothetical protein